MTKAARLVYLANARIPSERAHVLQIFKNCEAFAKEGFHVELVHPRRHATPAMRDVSDPFAYYQVERRFELVEIPMRDGLLGASSPLQAVLFSLQSLRFAARAVARVARDTDALVYTRDFYVATALAAKRRPFLFELHTVPLRGPKKAWMKFVGNRALGIIPITHELAEECRAAGAPREKILVAPDAVDEGRLTASVDRAVARSGLDLPADEPVAAYTGHFYRWKGMGTLVAAARLAPEVTFVAVGGTADAIDKWTARASSPPIANLRLLPHVSPGRVPEYLAAADVLLLPNSARTPLSSRHTSPLKAFEYMAAGRPVVASDLPSIREIFAHQATALLVPPDDPAALAGAIRRLIAEPALGERLASRARERVAEHTWTARARKILEFARSRGASMPDGAADAIACEARP